MERESQTVGFGRGKEREDWYMPVSKPKSTQPGTPNPTKGRPQRTGGTGERAGPMAAQVAERGPANENWALRALLLDSGHFKVLREGGREHNGSIVWAGKNGEAP